MGIASQMRLDRYVLRSLRIETRSLSGRQVAEGEAQLNISFTPEVRRRKDEPRFWISLRVDVLWPDEAKAPFDAISIALDGFFSFAKDTGEDTIKKYVPVLCLANLYGIARGIVSQATGVCEGGPFVLPLVDMNAVVRGWAAESSKAASPKKADKPRVSRRPRIRPHEN